MEKTNYHYKQFFKQFKNLIKKSLTSQVLPLFSTFRFLKGKLPYHCHTGISKLMFGTKFLMFKFLSIDFNLYVYFCFPRQRRCTRFSAHIRSAPYRAVHGQCITAHIGWPYASVFWLLGYVFIFIRDTLLECETNLTWHTQYKWGRNTVKCAAANRLSPRKICKTLSGEKKYLTQVTILVMGIFFN